MVFCSARFRGSSGIGLGLMGLSPKGVLILDRSSFIFPSKTLRVSGMDVFLVRDLICSRRDKSGVCVLFDLSVTRRFSCGPMEARGNALEASALDEPSAP